jgi:hypothetical protein
MPKSSYILAIENISSVTRCRDIRGVCYDFGTVLDVRYAGRPGVGARGASVKERAVGK